MCRLSFEGKREVILEHMSYAKNMAYYMAVRYDAIYNVDEFISLAYLGLTKAANRYNTDFGVKFKTYMVNSIKSEILDSFRNNKDRGLTGNLRRKDRPVQVYDRVLAFDDEDFVHGTYSWYDDIQLRFIRNEFNEIMRLLPEQHQRCLFLYYYSDLTMKEVSRFLGMTESGVSYLVDRILRKLAKLLKQKWGVSSIGEVLPEV